MERIPPSRKLQQEVEALLQGGDGRGHHLDVIKNADWLIDLGPGAGEKGGYLIAQGTPEQVAEVEDSYTGQYLKKLLARHRGQPVPTPRG